MGEEEGDRGVGEMEELGGGEEGVTGVTAEGGGVGEPGGERCEG